jgi:hypothetical protein
VGGITDCFPTDPWWRCGWCAEPTLVSVSSAFLIVQGAASKISRKDIPAGRHLAPSIDAGATPTLRPLDHPAKSLGLAVSDRSIRGVAEISPACSQLWSAIIASRPAAAAGASGRKTGVSRCRVRRLPAACVPIRAGSFPAAAQERITSIAILPVIGSVEIFGRRGLSAVAKEPPRVHSVTALLP